jgi:predicted transglutaminase-like cysteine proteinase
MITASRPSQIKIGLFRLKNLITLAYSRDSGNNSSSANFIRTLALSLSFLTPSLANAYDGIKVEAIFDPVSHLSDAVDETSVGDLISQHRTVLDGLRNLDDLEKLYIINTFFNNHITYTPDKKTSSSSDYWQSQQETLIRQSGDCEDFAIAKYFSLLQLNVDNTRLKVVYVNNRSINGAHMVLTYNSDVHSSPLVLDSNTNAIITLQESGYVPVYAFNSESLYLPNRSEPVSGVKNLSKWNGVLEKHRKFNTPDTLVALVP